MHINSKAVPRAERLPVKVTDTTGYVSTLAKIDKAIARELRKTKYCNPERVAELTKRRNILVRLI